MAEVKLRDMGRGRFGSSDRTATSVLLAMFCVVPSDPKSALCGRGVLSAGPTSRGEVTELASTWSMFSRQPPQKPASRGPMVEAW